MAVNIDIPMFILANVLADGLTLNNVLRVAPLHVRFVEDEMTACVSVPHWYPLHTSIGVPQ